MTSRHYSSDANEVNIIIVVDCFKIGVKLGMFNIAINGKTVRCTFNSFEQCICGIFALSRARDFISSLLETISIGIQCS